MTKEFIEMFNDKKSKKHKCIKWRTYIDFDGQKHDFCVVCNSIKGIK